MNVEPSGGCSAEWLETAYTDMVEDERCPVGDNKEDTFSYEVDPLQAPLFVEQGCRVSAVRAVTPFRLAPPEGYTPPEDLIAKYASFQESYPNLAQFIDITEELGMPPSHDGNHLHVLKISDNVSEDEDEPNLFLFTGIHAREILGVELNVRTCCTIKYLCFVQ
jgi:hypothetical protein